MLWKRERGQILVFATNVVLLATILLASPVQMNAESAQTASTACQVNAVDYKGWHAQQISNRWVQFIVVPQNGGRLIQVTFAGHPYLFVNPKYEGKYFPPTQSKWFNYGNDKYWLLLEGHDDEQ